MLRQRSTLLLRATRHAHSRLLTREPETGHRGRHEGDAGQLEKPHWGSRFSRLLLPSLRLKIVHHHVVDVRFSDPGLCARGCFDGFRERLVATNRERLGSGRPVGIKPLQVQKGNTCTDKFWGKESLASDRKGVAEVVALLQFIGDRGFHGERLR